MSGSICSKVGFKDIYLTTISYFLILWELSIKIPDTKSHLQLGPMELIHCCSSTFHRNFIHLLWTTLWEYYFWIIIKWWYKFSNDLHYIYVEILLLEYLMFACLNHWILWIWECRARIVCVKSLYMFWSLWNDSDLNFSPLWSCFYPSIEVLSPWKFILTLLCCTHLHW